MKTFIGKVISKKMQKTATVIVERVVTHPLYGKKFKRIKKYHVHDELGTLVGDEVVFVPSRPYSRLKKWKVVKVIKSEGKNKKEDQAEKVRLESKKKRVRTKKEDKK
jgi:small subunit ribosomal protein S17